MATSVQEPPGYQHPRWFVWCAALGFAALYLCALVVANVFPYYRQQEQEHGWPFVYMVREGRVPGGLTIYYGPWPLDDPPLLKFWPAMLVANVLCGVALAAVASTVPVYWLRVRGRPVHFSLLSLFVLTTLVACICSLLKWFNPSANYFSMAVAAIVLSSWFALAFFPACMVLMVAHWLVLRFARCRWILTWIAVCAVGVLCLHFVVSDVYRHNGWPWKYDFQSQSGSNAQFNPFAFVGDWMVWLAVVPATGFVVARWARRVQERVTFTNVSFLAAVVALTVPIWTLSWDQWFGPQWYEYYAWYFGLAATIYAIEVLTVRHWKATPKISVAAGFAAGSACWFVSSPLLLDNNVVTGLSLVAGAAVAAAVDAGYRLMAHRDRGVSRFVRPDCGEHFAVLPAWIVSIVGIAGGLALAYTSF